MPQTFDFGPKQESEFGMQYRKYFAHWIRLNRLGPVFERRTTLTQEPPYLVGRSAILHLWGTKIGLVVGKWTGERLDEDNALLAALNCIDKEELPKLGENDTDWEDDEPAGA
ncbi:hypothetical protein [Nonomuraea sp. SYSU D8015]|uniref:hypothetical protein n=1 Tax=Nonomuraea sp. SYSU D8015 TaxID=2593644 RepID=UPI0016606C07|nr:hypothetical protein [Nonomuraea sp. SYSU D8015]